VFSGTALGSIVFPSFLSVLPKHCFMARTTLKSVVFDNVNELEAISESAFERSGLESIKIPACVQVLCPSCFAHCKSLRKISFEAESRLKRIEAFAFSQSCESRIEIPSSVEFIDWSAFLGFHSNSISFSTPNDRYQIFDSFIADISGQILYRYIGDSSSVVIPLFITVLGKSSFRDCKSLTSIWFEVGSKLTCIDEFAFSGSGITSIVIPSSVSVLGKSSFRDCKSLISISFEDGSQLERIDELAFSGSGITSIVIPSSVSFVAESSGLDIRLISVRV
jgi:hypothetical protein